MTPTLSYQVRPEDQGSRLDRVLARAWPELTRTRIQSLLESGSITVDGAPGRGKDPVRPGSLVLATLPAPRPSHLVPEARELSIVYEDEHLLVVDKPAGLVVHPGAGVSSGTLVHALLAHSPGIEGVGGVSRPGLVHRLDKDTSGLMAVAKTDAAYRGLVTALHERNVHRRYVALVWGVPKPPNDRIEAPVGRDPRDRKKMAVRPVGSPGSRPAVTNYRTLAELPTHAMRPRFAWLEVELETGRTHQIRVHLSHRGHPVVGDSLYGGDAKKALSLPPDDRRLANQLVTGLGRQGLHAAELEFVHPIRGEALLFRAPLPHDMARALEVLGLLNRPAHP